MRHIIHVSGYALAQDPKLQNVVTQKGEAAKGKYGDWEHVCWGERATGALGRIPMALWYANQVSANHIVWSTGCQRIKDGAWEAQVFFERAVRSFDQLREDFPHRFSGLWYEDETAYQHWLRSNAVLDIESTTTSTSMEWLVRYMRKNFTGPTTVHLVSSANHVPRVLRDAMDAFNYDYRKESNRQRVTLVAVPAETDYGKKWVQDVKVLDLGE